MKGTVKCNHLMSLVLLQTLQTIRTELLMTVGCGLRGVVIIDVVVYVGWAGTRLFIDNCGTRGWSKTSDPRTTSTVHKKIKASTHCCRRFHQNCPRSRPSRCTRRCEARSGRSRSACSPSCTHGWLRTKKQAEEPNYKSQTNNEHGCSSTGRKKNNQQA